MEILGFVLMGFGIGFFLGRKSASTSITTPRPVYNVNVQHGAGMTEENKKIITDMIRKNDLIEAIKLVREMTGMGLKESKDFVEELKKTL